MFVKKLCSKIFNKKFIILTVICLLIVTTVTIAIRVRPIYIVGFGGTYKVAVPLKMRFTRNCDQYAEFVKSILGPMFLPNPRNCPWVNVDLSKDAEFTIKGTTFKIPRDYLIFGGSKEPNGEVNSILMEFEYPSMNPPDWSKKDLKKEDEKGVMPKDYFLTVLISYDDAKDKNERMKSFYLNSSSINAYLERDKKEYHPKKKKYHPNLKLTQYENHNSFYDIFIQGDVYNPDYWLICDKPSKVYKTNPGCDRREFLPGKPITIKYSFRKKSLLQHHEDVRNKVLSKLNELIIN